MRTALREQLGYAGCRQPSLIESARDSVASRTAAGAERQGRWSTVGGSDPLMVPTDGPDGLGARDVRSPGEEEGD